MLHIRSVNILTTIAATTLLCSSLCNWLYTIDYCMACNIQVCMQIIIALVRGRQLRVQISTIKRNMYSSRAQLASNTNLVLVFRTIDTCVPNKYVASKFIRFKVLHRLNMHAYSSITGYDEYSIRTVTCRPYHNSGQVV